MKPARKLAGGMPRWHPWITVHGSAKWMLDEGSSAAVLKNKRIAQKWEENGNKVLCETLQIGGKIRAMLLTRIKALKQDRKYRNFNF